MFTGDLGFVDTFVFGHFNRTLDCNGRLTRPAPNNSYAQGRWKVLTKISILLSRSVTVDNNVFKTAPVHSRALYAI